MLEKLKKHHAKHQKKIKGRLSDFSKNRNAPNKVFLEEMAFCVFAANSSARMGLKAVELLRNVLEHGSLEDYRRAVHKKVRFYNKRAEYMHHNREKVYSMHRPISTVLSQLGHEERRMFLKENFKGFGTKESSHLLRNLGYEGYCIIDKHVLNTLKELNVLKSAEAPKNEKEYLEIEKKLIEFAREHKINIDELDLAIWSWKTGEIIK